MNGSGDGEESSYVSKDYMDISSFSSKIKVKVKAVPPTNKDVMHSYRKAQRYYDICQRGIILQNCQEEVVYAKRFA